jgi:hypothetical protein
MSSQFSTTMLKLPGDDPRFDLTDLFVLTAPENAGRTILIFDVNPFMAAADLNPEAVDRLNIDNDGDTEVDVAFSFGYTQSNGTQTATVGYATGSNARRSEAVGEVLIEGMHVDFHAMAKLVQAGRCRLFIACAATRSSPTARARPTTSSSPASTYSPARTSSRWRSGYATTRPVPAQRSQSGRRRACGATASWSRSTGTGTPRPVARRHEGARLRRQQASSSHRGGD